MILQGHILFFFVFHQFGSYFPLIQTWFCDSFNRRYNFLTQSYGSWRMSENEFINDNSETITHLRKIPALECFNEDDLKDFLRFSEVKTYAENDVIIAENSKDDRVFYLISGKAKVIKNGRELIILRRTGDVFGEIGVVTGVARSATVIASSPTMCVSIRLSEIDKLDEKNRLTFKYMVFRGFAEILANRLKKTTEELLDAQNKIHKHK
jgi:CRP/FNR family transcriptional regulator, cyclic AMP receptor protein